MSTRRPASPGASGKSHSLLPTHTRSKKATSPTSTSSSRASTSPTASSRSATSPTALSSSSSRHATSPRAATTSLHPFPLSPPLHFLHPFTQSPLWCVPLRLLTVTRRLLRHYTQPALESLRVSLKVLASGEAHPFQKALGIISVIVFSLFVWSLFIRGPKGPLQTTPCSPQCRSPCSPERLLDERPSADWSLSAKAVTVSILNLPHNPLMNRRRTAKIAFLFLVQRDLPHQRLWARFFKGFERQFSVFIHTWERTQVFRKGNVESVFEGTEIPWKEGTSRRPGSTGSENSRLKTSASFDSKTNSLSSMSIVDAQRRLLSWALTDSDNYFFVFVTEFCAPIRNFTSTYDYIVKSRHSFVDVYNDLPGPSGAPVAYRRKMSPLIEPQDFTTGTPWGVTLGRAHATAVVADTMFYKVFKAFCKGGEGGMGWAQRALHGGQVPHGSGSVTAGRGGVIRGSACLPERHYIQTLLHIVDGQGIVPRSLTHEPEFEWDGGKRGKWGKGGRETGGESENEGGDSMSGTLTSEDIVTIATQRSILRSPFEPEVPCVVNGARHTCFLFARPFSRQQTEGLLSLPRNVLLS